MFNKVVSFVSTGASITGILIAGQMGMVSEGFAADAPTPEMNLLENVIALEGQNLSQSEAQTRLSTLLTSYAQSSPAIGQQQRMEEALIQLGLYTPQQAQALITEVESSSQTLSLQETSQAGLTSSMTAELSKLVSSYPAGAQFSACDAISDPGVYIAAAVGSSIGALTWALTASNGGPEGLEVGAEVLTSACFVAGLLFIWANVPGGPCW